MATGNLFQGTARGKVGDVVFFRTDGEQRSRLRIRKIKDPRSQAQQIQRAITATVVEAYSFMSEICDHSFEGVPYGQKSMYYFNKINADKLRSTAYDMVNNNEGTAYFAAPKVSALIPNEYIISKGSLTNNLGYRYDATKKAFVLECAKTIVSEEATFGDFLKAVGLMKPGSQLTFCSIVPNPKAAPLYALGKQSGSIVANCRFEFDRIVRNDVEISNDDAKGSLGLLNIINPNKPFVGNTVPEVLWKYFEVDAVTQPWIKRLERAAIGTGFEIQDSDEFAVGIIKSEKIGETWKRSSESLIVTPDNDAMLGLNYNRMLQAWTEGTLKLGESEYYLNGGI